MNNGTPVIDMSDFATKYLRERIDWILDLMDKEHHHCHTHSQRNAYQAVIRHELEVLREDIQHNSVRLEGGEIPF